jgi:hypothetical protein
MNATLRFALTLGCLCFSVTAGRADWGVPQPGTPYAAPGGPAVVAGSSPCSCETCPRPGLLTRLRERLRGNSSSACCSTSCSPRPGLLTRIRNRIADRRAARTSGCP